ncbi:MAG: hypothetical protein HC914_13885 [Chloroflexaceae bacterium]|nr:hypothetical protein [Chloroflexaceae bacterium]
MRAELLRLWEEVEQMCSRALSSMHSGQTTPASWVVAQQPQVHRNRRYIEHEVLSLLATQQPIVAFDLRLVLAIPSIASDLETIADDAVTLGRRTLATAAPTLPDTACELSMLLHTMLQTGREAFVQQDVELARTLGKLDRRAHTLLGQLRATPTEHYPTCSPELLIEASYGMAAIASRSTRIAERVIYMLTCTSEELNPPYIR